MIELIISISSMKVYYIDDLENIVDITDKCYMKLYDEISGIVGLKELFNSGDIYKSEPIEEIYTLLLEKIATTHYDIHSLKLRKPLVDKLVIAFRKVFIEKIESELNVTVSKISYE